MLYGRTPEVSTDAALQSPVERSLIDLDIKVSQGKQKLFHDRKSKDPKISVGDRVMVYFPSEHLGKTCKFSRPFHGPYQVDKVFPNGAEVTSLSSNKT